MEGRDKCKIELCQRTVMSIGNGKFAKLCRKHYKQRFGMDWSHNSKQRRKKKIRSDRCVLCGWLGPCEIHRIRFGHEGGGYVNGNMISICPNCHTLLHRGNVELIFKTWIK